MSSRLQTRCLVGSVIAHVGLCVLLIFAPAFKPESNAAAQGGPALEIMSSAMVDALLATSAAPTEPAAAAPTTPPPPQMAPPVPEPQEPEPPARRPEAKQPARTPLEAPESPSKEFVVAPKKTPEKEKPADRKTPPKPAPRPKESPKFDFAQVKTVVDAKARKNPATSETARNAPPPEDPSRVRARALGGILANAAGSLAGTGNARGAVNIQIAGGGGSGVPGGGMGSANPLAIRNAYFAAWVTPPNVTDDLATVETEVTILRDGTVLRSRVTRKSGVAALDRSVEDALQRVKRITPFDPYPDPALQQQTFKIGFNLRARNQF